MKLNEIIERLSDNEYVQEALYEVSDALFLHSLENMRQRFINDYINVKNGVALNIFVVNDLEQDAFEISRRIEATDILIDQFKVDHVPFDFDGFPWWDDDDDEDVQ
jgi:hypothetical protein